MLLEKFMEKEVSFHMVGRNGYQNQCPGKI